MTATFLSRVRAFLGDAFQSSTTALHWQWGPNENMVALESGIRDCSSQSLKRGGLSRITGISLGSNIGRALHAGKKQKTHSALPRSFMLACCLNKTHTVIMSRIPAKAVLQRRTVSITRFVHASITFGATTFCTICVKGKIFVSSMSSKGTRNTTKHTSDTRRPTAIK